MIRKSIKQIVVITIILLFAQTIIGQIQFLKQPYDYGLINSNNQYVDIPIKNIGDKKVFIFRADVDAKKFQVHYSSKTILPDSTIYVRVMYQPIKKGGFSEKIPIHFSCYDEPKSIKITGFVEEVKSSRIACPSFSQENRNNDISFQFKVKVIDQETKEPIEKAQVLMIKNGLIAQNLKTNRNGIAAKKVDLGFYYFVTSKEGYITKEFPKYINRKSDYLVIELKRDSLVKDLNEEISLVVTETQTAQDIIEEEKKEEEDTEEIILVLDENTEEKGEEIKELPKEHPKTSTVEKYPELPLSKYKPNNIVFLIDISASMKYTGKLDLLKASMIEMTKLLRDVDNITIVTYASSTKIAMETTSANNKDSIISTIEGLTAGGMTAGGKGLKMAYSKACEAFIAHGNNEIIMATDGDFNSGKENVNKLAKKYKAKGVKVSVIGIKNRKHNEENMKKLATSGGGNYMKIDTFEDAKKRLIEEVKSSSKL